MSRVETYTEWDPLEEVIVGIAAGARIPTADPGLHRIAFDAYERIEEVPSGPYPAAVIDRTEEELDALAETLRGLGITVRRPARRDLAASFGSPSWRSDGYFDYCPRDGFLTFERTIIETPMVLRARYFEADAYRDLFLEYFRSGARWLSAPKPKLPDEAYLVDNPRGARLANLEPCFDAANVLKCGEDLFYLVSDSGNELGRQWLQSILGADYRVHPCRNLYASTHIDSTIVPLRPGLVLLNPERVNESNLPPFFRHWDKIWCPQPVDTGFVGKHPACSIWIGMNLLVVRPGLVVADDRQVDLIRLLGRHGVESVPCRLTHARTLGGGFHCATLDVRRRGQRQRYD